jgi:hypothetical protein
LQRAAAELREQFLGSVVRKAGIDRDELLIQDRRAEESSHLLFFRGIAWEGEGVAKAREDKAGDAALKRLEKRQLSALESNDEIALMEFDAVRAGDCVNVLGIEPKVIQRSEDVPRGRIRGGESGATR